MRIALFIAFSALFACSPQKRLNNLLKHHPELSVDTVITIHDTVSIKGTSIDTSFSSSVDTLVIHDSIMTITYIHDKVHDKVYIKGAVKDREVLISKTIKVKSPVITKTLYKEHWYSTFLKYWFLFSIILMAFYLFLSRNLKLF